MKISRIKEKLDEILKTIKFKYYLASPGTDVIAELLNYPHALFSTDVLINKKGEFRNGMVNKVGAYSDLMLDSGIFNPSITNKDILRTAEKFRPKIIVPKDYFFDNPRTIASIKEFASLLGSYNLKGTKILIPLQRPWNIDHAFRNHDYFAIGGIIKLSGPAKRKVIEKIAIKHKNKNFHLFGAGLKAFSDIVYKHKNIVSSDTNMDRKASIDRCRVFKTSGKHFSIVSEFYVLVSFLDEIVAYYNYIIDSKQRKTQTVLF